MTRRFEPVLQMLNDAWERRVTVPLERTNSPVACLEDLLDLKRRAGRAQDLEDVAALQGLIESSFDD